MMARFCHFYIFALPLSLLALATTVSHVHQHVALYAQEVSDGGRVVPKSIMRVESSIAAAKAVHRDADEQRQPSGSSSVVLDRQGVAQHFVVSKTAAGTEAAGAASNTTVVNGTTGNVTSGAKTVKYNTTTAGNGTNSSLNGNDTTAVKNTTSPLNTTKYNTSAAGNGTRSSSNGTVTTGVQGSTGVDNGTDTTTRLRNSSTANGGVTSSTDVKTVVHKDTSSSHTSSSDYSNHATNQSNITKVVDQAATTER